ncbi:efflux RND transporter periplasmic adaptor subunit [Candidatus Roizmanbacteria bacterium]|nr:efflux RND transporter periplasmic adaptor subunit [Candidatus Roizmanbacteria bacterium]
MLGFLKKRWYVVLILVVVGGFFVYKSTQKQIIVKKDSAYKVKKQTLRETLSLSGQIDAHEHTVLRFQSSGKLTWVGVKQGETVKKFQGIASLDQRDIQMRLQKYLNSYMKTRWNFDQTKSDTEDTIIGGLTDDLRAKAQRILDGAQFDLNNSVLDVQLQNLAKETAYLSSPIEGIIVRADAPFAGVNITPAQAEFEIVNPKTIYFQATADQTDVPNVYENMSGTITLDSFPDNKISGTVSSVAYTPKSGESGTVYEVKIKMDDTSADWRNLRMGMTGDVEFTLREHANVISVPSQYIKSQAGKKYVIRDNKGKKEQTIVKIGDVVDNDTEVTSGLHEGDVIYD